MIEEYSWGLQTLRFSVRICETDVTAPPWSVTSLPVTRSSRVLDMQGAWLAICTGTDTTKTEGDALWMLWGRVEDLSLGRNKATGEVIRARSTTGSGDLQLHSERKQLWHKTEPHEKEDCVSAAFVLTRVLGSCPFCKEMVKTNIQLGLSQDIPTGHNRSRS